MRVAARILLGLIAVVAALAAAGAAYQWFASAEDGERFPPPGRLLDVEGLEMHVDCRGSGRPVVILEAGLTTGSSSWALVHDEMSRTTEVCAYDRPGLDWSEPRGRTADAGEVVDRLHTLIRAADLDGPYLLVGMSAGGMYVREYYHRHPEEVVGMVLVDSSHEQQDERLPAAGDPTELDRMVSLCRLLQPVGVTRLLGVFEGLVNQPSIPEAVRPLMLASLNQSHYCAAMGEEIASFNADLEMAAAPRSLGDLPLVVLSQGNEPQSNGMFGISVEEARAQRAVWDDLQVELAALSSRGRRIVAAESGHMIQLEQPRIVIDAVAGMVEELRGR